MAAEAVLVRLVREITAEIHIESIHNMSAAEAVELVEPVEIPRAQSAELEDLLVQLIHHGQQLHPQECLEPMQAAAVADLDALRLEPNTTAEQQAAAVVLAALAYMEAHLMRQPTLEAAVAAEQSVKSLLDTIILLAMVAPVLSLSVIQSKENQWHTSRK